MKVLAVDDDVVARMMLMHLVDNCGKYEITEAEDGEEAWRLLGCGERPDIVFCDLRMPKLDGMGLLARVRAAAHDPGLKTLPFVLVSAASDADTLAEAGRLGADGYIVKPFAAGQVRAQLARLAPQDEAPESVLRRLGIGPERLLAYLGGLRRQLEAAAPDGESAARMLRLAEGCATLGLADSAALLHAAGTRDDARAGAAALAHALAAVERQCRRAQAMQ